MSGRDRLAAPLRRAIAAAATLTGRRFGLFVASSLVATSAIVASALTNPTGPIGPLAALLGRSMAASNAPADGSPEPSPSAPSARSQKRLPPSSRPASPAPAAEQPPTPAPSPPPAEARGPESKGGELPTAPPSPTASQPEAGRIKHVFVISLASPGYEAAFGPASTMPYLSTTLRPQGELLSGYTLLSDAALPNGIAAISGQPPSTPTQEDCPAFDCLFPVETGTIADQLNAGRFTWHAYMEDMADTTGNPHSCVYPDPAHPSPPPIGGYAAWQNPFVYFHSLLDLGECALNDVPLTELPAGLGKAEKTPNYSFIAPDPCNAGAPGQCPEGKPGGAAAADAFLSEWVPKILASAAYKKDGLLIVSFGETAAPGPVGALLLSPFVSPGSSDAAPYGPYSLLRSVEDLFGLPHLGAAGAAKVKSFAPALLGKAGGGD